jgi:hypothetical protein
VPLRVSKAEYFQESASQSFRDKCFGEGEKKRKRGENQNLRNKEEGKKVFGWGDELSVILREKKRKWGEKEKR